MRTLDRNLEINRIVAEEVAVFEAMCEDAQALVPQQPHGRQRLFLDDLGDVLEAMFGGAAGGAKSSALLLAALEYIHIPHYAAILLRRTYKDLALPDAIMSRAQEWLIGKDGVRWDSDNYTFHFACKGGGESTLTFGYMDTDSDKYRYQSSAFQFCVEAETRVLMADGSYRAIRDISAGEMVATLSGPRRVSKVFRLGAKPCAKLVNPFGVEAIVGSSHRLLTPDGWADPLALRPQRFRVADSTGAISAPQSQAACRRPLCLPKDQRPISALAQRILRDMRRPERFAYQAVGQSDFLAFGDELRAVPPPPAWNARLVLLERALRLNQHRNAGFPRDYRAARDFDEQRSLRVRAGDRSRIPLPAEVVAAGRPLGLSGDPASIQPRIRPEYEFPHPYTNALLRCVESVSCGAVEISLAGEAEVFDLRVEEASHYILAGGFVSVNCGFDELTQFLETQYLYMFSRLRRPAVPCRHCLIPMKKASSSGIWVHQTATDCEIPEGAEVSMREYAKLYDVPLRMRSATNPGGLGHEWVKQRFIPEDYPGPDEARVYENAGEDQEGRIFHTYFVPSRLQDNPFLDQETYLEGLGRLDRVTGRQLLYGDWAISPTGQCYFNFDAVARFAPIAPAIGELLEVEDELNEKQLLFSQRTSGHLAMWEKPQAGHFYVIGADTASGRDANRGAGKTSRDFSVCQVRDAANGKQVARYRAQVSERLFGEVWARLSKFYNHAYIVPAVTGGYGRAALNRAMDCGLKPHLIYCQEDETGMPGKRVQPVDLGFTETTVTRPTLYSNLDLAILQHAIETCDAVTINEYYSFETNKDGKPEARAGCKDDCVTSDALCVKGLRVAPKYLRQMNEQKQVNQLPKKYGQRQMSEKEREVYVREMRKRNSIINSRKQG